MIRKCRMEDERAVYELICELKEKEFNYDNFSTAFQNKMSDDRNYYILCIEGDTPIGFLSLSIDYQLHHASKVATVEELIVSSRFRSRGAGKALLQNAVFYAKEKNCDVIELTSGFKREKAHEFYIRNGFSKGSFKFKMNL